MLEGKLIKTNLEIEAKEYEQKQGYHGLLEVLYEEGQNKGYECARSYIAPNIIRAYLAGAEPREKRIADLERKLEQAEKDLSDYQFNYPTIKELQKENAELKEQINEWLNAYSDTYFVKVLRDCIFHFEKLSSQEQQQLSAWVECAMDFGTKLDECADQLAKAKGLLAKWVELYNPKLEDFQKPPIQIDTEQFLSEVEK